MLHSIDHQYETYNLTDDPQLFVESKVTLEKACEELLKSSEAKMCEERKKKLEKYYMRKEKRERKERKIDRKKERRNQPRWLRSLASVKQWSRDLRVRIQHLPSEIGRFQFSR